MIPPLRQQQSLFHSALCLFLLLPGCRETEQAEVPAPPAEINRGDWHEAGYLIELQEVRRIVLDTGGEGFITRMLDFNVRFHGSRLYVADVLKGSGINVYDSLGRFLTNIPIPSAPDARSGGFVVFPDQSILFKDIAGNQIIEFDSLGVVRTLLKASEGSDSPMPFPKGLEIVYVDDSRYIYTSIFNDYTGREFLENSNLIAFYDYNGILQGSFARYSDIYRQLNLTTYMGTDFIILDNFIYLLEDASPKIRVYSLDGKLTRDFGTLGNHYIPVRQRFRDNMMMDEISAAFVKASSFGGIYRIYHPKMGQLVGTSYANFDREFTESRIRTYNHSTNYLIVYSPDGRVLYNDLELPGRLVDVDSAGRLIVNIDDSPDHRVIGIFELVVHAQDIATGEDRADQGQ